MQISRKLLHKPNKFINKFVNNGYLPNRLTNLFGNNHIKYDTIHKTFYETVDGNKVFLQRPRDPVGLFKDGSSHLEKLCSQVYFSHYTPKKNEVYIDIGAGYGHESIWLAMHNQGVIIHNIEANPIVYSHLCKSTEKFSNIQNYNLVISKEDVLSLPFSSDYISVDSHNDKNPIKINGISLDDFLKKSNIKYIDLLKMNIEGAEIDVMQNINDFSKIKRFVISCHDFRANNGEGEFFRTKDRVIAILKENGFTIQNMDSEWYNGEFLTDTWLNDWIYAEKV